MAWTVYGNMTLLDHRSPTIQFHFLPPIIWLLKMQHLWDFLKIYKQGYGNEPILYEILDTETLG